MKKFMIKWYIKQLFPLTYISIGKFENEQYETITIFKMWFGNHYNVKRYKIIELN